MFFGTSLSRLRYRLTLVFVLMMATMALGTFGFMIIEHQPMFDSFYMTLITVTTIGYGEMFPLSHHGRVFNSILILTGNVMVLVAFGVMTQTVIELELNQFLGNGG